MKFEIHSDGSTKHSLMDRLRADVGKKPVSLYCNSGVKLAGLVFY